MRLISHKTLRNILIGLMAMIVLLVALPVVLIDKDDVRQKLSHAVYEATGRSLEVGDIGFAVLPSPRFTAEDIRLANWDKSSEPWMLDIAKVTVIAAPMDLLSGKVTARSVQLDSPRVLLEQSAAGKNWKFLPPGALPQRLSSASRSANTLDLDQALAQLRAQAPLTAQTLPGLGGRVDVVFEQVQIRDGQVHYVDTRRDTAQPTVVKNINLDVDAKTMAGPFFAKGTVRYAGQDIALNGVVDEVTGERAIPLRVDLASVGTSLHLDGLLLRDTGTGPVLKGNIATKSDNLGKTLSELGQVVPDKLQGVPVALNGELRVATDAGELKSGQLQVGPDQVATEIIWKLEDGQPNVAVSLNAQRIRLDDWLNAKTASLLPNLVMPQLLQSAHAAQAAQPAQPASEQTSPVLTIPKLPRNVDVVLDARADTVVLHGQAVHNLTLDAALSHGDVVINKLAAEMPGAATLNVFGFVATAQDAPSLDLTAQAKAANLRGTLGWLGLDLSSMPSDRMRRAAINTALQLGQDGLLKLREMELTLDSSKATGAADVRLLGRPAIGLTLAVDQVNLDAYRPVKGAQAARMSDDLKIIYAAAEAQAVKPLFDLTPLQALDANINLTVGRLIASKQVLEKVNLQGTLQNGDIMLSKLYAGLGYAGQLSASGMIQTLGQRVPQLQDVKVAVKSTRGDKLMRMLGGAPKFTETWRDLEATINATGPLTNLTTNALIIPGKTRIHAVGALDLLRGLPTADTQLNVTAPTMRAFAQTFGGSVAPELANFKNVSLSAPIQHQKTGLALPAIQFRASGAQEIKVDGNAILKTDGPRPHVSVTLSGNTLPIFAGLKASSYVSKVSTPQARIIPAAFVPVAAKTTASAGPWAVLRGFDGVLNAKFDQVVTPKLSGQNVTIAADLNQGILNITKATGDVLGGQVSMTGQMDVRQTPTITVKLNANDVTVTKDSPLFAGDVAPFTGIATVTADLQTTGVDRDSFLQALNGSGTLDVADGSVVGTDLDAVNARIANINTIDDVLQAINAGRGGRTVFDSLKGTFTIEQGVMRSDDIAIAAPSGAGGLTGVANLFSRTMNLKANYALANLKDAPALGVRLEGGWERPRVFFDIQAFQGYVLQRGIGQFLNLLNKKNQKSQPQTEQNATPQDSSATSEQTEQKQQKIKVKDVLRGILQAIPQN